MCAIRLTTRRQSIHWHPNCVHVRTERTRLYATYLDIGRLLVWQEGFGCQEVVGLASESDGGW